MSVSYLTFVNYTSVIQPSEHTHNEYKPNEHKPNEYKPNEHKYSTQCA